MSAAARSLYVFGAYAILAGIGLVMIPGLVLGTLGFPPSGDEWVRVVGLLAMCVGTYHLVAGRHDFIPYIRASVPLRFAFAVALASLVYVGVMPRALLLFAAIDLLGAVWTGMALRAQGVGIRASPST